MKMATVVVVSLLVVSAAGTILAKDGGETRQTDPFACLQEAEKIGRGTSISNIYREISRRKEIRPPDVLGYCIIAELLKRVGDYEAEEYYKKAIAADAVEPAYEFC